MKSKYVGKIINNCKITNSEYKLNNTGKSGCTYYELECLDCGKVFIRPGASVQKGCARCKCSYLSHHFRINNAYRNMKDRCYNPNNKGYKNYGAKGIKICDEWLKDYNSFKEWSLNNGYQEDLTIDRINNNGNYEPSNCRWVTKSFNCGHTSRFGKDKIKNYHPQTELNKH